MAMLDALRKQATGWVAQILIGLLVLSFAIWGVSGFFSGFYADTIATVGKTDISTVRFARTYDQAIQGMTRQTGRPVTAEQAQLFGLPSQVLGRLVTEATLDDTARQYGLGVSNEALARRIGEDPAFRGPDGTFSRLNFQQVLRNVGYTEDQYITDQHDVLLRYQLSNSLVSGAHAPEPYLQALHEYRSEERSIEYVVLTADVAGDVGEPSQEELKSFFEENNARWRAPEYRALTFFEVSPADIADPAEITDEQAQAAYDRNVDEYSNPERRKVSQMIFDTEAEATAAAEAIAEGKSFDDVAGERDLSPADTSLGLVARTDIIDPQVAETAFSLASGSTSGAVQGGFGWVIVRVDEIQPGETMAFEDVKDKIKDELALELAKKRLINTFDEVEDARAAGETFQEIADKIGTSLNTIEAVDRSGNDEEGTAVADLPATAELLAGVFESDVGIENDAVRTADGGYVWYEVTAITPERDRALDEVREKVVADWKQARIGERLTAEAEDIRSRLDAGEGLEAIADELGLPVKTALNITRSSQPPTDLTAAAVGATFAGPEGHVAVTDGSGLDVLKAVLVVTGVYVPPFNRDAPNLAQARKQISDQIANDYLQQFIVEKQNDLGISVNQTALQGIVGQVRPGL
jgi:peptidyl-prolyl cis-trans isomerase D